MSQGSFGSLQRKWDPGLMISPEDFPQFCSTVLDKSGESLLFIGTVGFDPRSCVGCAKILEERGSDNFDAILIDINEGRLSPSTKHQGLVNDNSQKFKNILDEANNIERETISKWQGSGSSRKRSNPRLAEDILPAEAELRSYDKIVFDISAMPKGNMFSIIGKTISILRGLDSPDIFAIVTENPNLDKSIEAIGPEDSATYIPGYGTSLEQEATLSDPSIWIPVLGENKKEHLKRAHDTIEPDEVLPVFPSPSLDPRRSDDLLNEYHKLLFDKWLVEPTNFVYASESNPFDLYRQILNYTSDYRDALAPIGECKFAITAASSKLLSIGAMLAVLDLKWNGFSTGLAQVRYDGYQLLRDSKSNSRSKSNDVYCIGLSGEPYDEN